MIELTKQQSLLLNYKQQNILANQNRFTFKTKVRIQCLKCFTPIYINYFNQNVNIVFCENHKHLANTKNVAQLQYLRLIKEKINNETITNFADEK